MSRQRDVCDSFVDSSERLVSNVNHDNTQPYTFGNCFYLRDQI